MISKEAMALLEPEQAIQVQKALAVIYESGICTIEANLRKEIVFNGGMSEPPEELAKRIIVWREACVRLDQLDACGREYSTQRME